MKTKAQLRVAIIREVQRTCCIQTDPADDTSFRVANHDEAKIIADVVVDLLGGAR